MSKVFTTKRKFNKIKLDQDGALSDLKNERIFEINLRSDISYKKVVEISLIENYLIPYEPIGSDSTIATNIYNISFILTGASDFIVSNSRIKIIFHSGLDSLNLLPEFNLGSDLNTYEIYHGYLWEQLGTESYKLHFYFHQSEEFDEPNIPIYVNLSLIYLNLFNYEKF
jgi:hypothetical protein